MERIVLLVSVLFVLVSHGVEGESFHQIQRNSESLPTEQSYRTSYHFQPPKNWMNDPNGPMYYKGVYHLFYQYNPFAAVWGNIVWAHSVSYDLINWIHLDHAISPADPFDINGCWSGSATILPGNKPAIIYTGSNHLKQQVQNLAIPRNLSDPLLTEWAKFPQNPLLSPVNYGIDPDFYRDPTTAWRGSDGKWRIIIGSQKDGHGLAVLYHSEDFINWEKSENPLHFSDKTEMWECPDFFPVSLIGENGVDTSVITGDIKHVLKASFNHHDYYVIGDYEAKTDEFKVEIDFMDSDFPLRYDYGKFYASKSFFDSEEKRRVLWAWINESDSEADDIKKGWSGLQSFPRSIYLSKNGKQLVQWPIKEIEKLHTKQVNLHDKELKGGSMFQISGITASQADVEVSFDLPSLEEAEVMNSSFVDPQLLCSQKGASERGHFGPFGLLVLASKDLEEHTAIFFRIFKNHGKFVVLMCSDQSRSSLRDVDKTTYGAFVDVDPLHEKISLRSLIDHSIVESFGGEGKACITARVYPQLALGEEASLYVFNNGTKSVKISKLDAWSMKEAQIVPIKKRGKSPTN